VPEKWRAANLGGVGYSSEQAAEVRLSERLLVGVGDEEGGGSRSPPALLLDDLTLFVFLLLT